MLKNINKFKNINKIKNKEINKKHKYIKIYIITITNFTSVNDYTAGASNSKL